MISPLPFQKGEDEGEGFSSLLTRGFEREYPIYLLLTLVLSSHEEERRRFSIHDSRCSFTTPRHPVVRGLVVLWSGRRSPLPVRRSGGLAVASYKLLTTAYRSRPCPSLSSHSHRSRSR